MGSGGHETDRADPVARLGDEIGRIVSERQALRAAGAGGGALESNRRRLVRAQGELSRLLIDRHLPHRAAAR